MDASKNASFCKITSIILLGLSTLALLTLLTSCASTTAQTAKITLEASGGTGYEWVNDSDQQHVLKLTDESTDADTDLAGGPVKSTYTLTAEQEGTAAITFKLTRSWEPADDDQYVTYTFSVDKNKQITVDGSEGTYPNIPEPVLS